MFGIKNKFVYFITIIVSSFLITSCSFTHYYPINGDSTKFIEDYEFCSQMAELNVPLQRVQNYRSETSNFYGTVTNPDGSISSFQGSSYNPYSGLESAGASIGSAYANVKRKNLYTRLCLKMNGYDLIKVNSAEEIPPQTPYFRHVE